MKQCKPDCFRSDYVPLSSYGGKKVFFCRTCGKRHSWKVDENGAPIKKLTKEESSDA